MTDFGADLKIWSHVILIWIHSDQRYRSSNAVPEFFSKGCGKSSSDLKSSDKKVGLNLMKSLFLIDFSVCCYSEVIAGLEMLSIVSTVWCWCYGTQYPWKQCFSLCETSNKPRMHWYPPAIWLSGWALYPYGYSQFIPEEY